MHDPLFSMTYVQDNYLQQILWPISIIQASAIPINLQNWSEISGGGTGGITIGHQDVNIKIKNGAPYNANEHKCHAWSS